MKTVSAVHVAMVLTVASQAWYTNYARSQEVDIKAATDGRCDYWLKMLEEKPSELVKFTGTDKSQPKVKVLVDGDSWRIVLLAGAEKPLFACTILKGDGPWMVAP